DATPKPAKPQCHSESNIRIIGRLRLSNCGCRGPALLLIARKFIRCSRKFAHLAWQTEDLAMSRRPLRSDAGNHGAKGRAAAFRNTPGRPAKRRHGERFAVPLSDSAARWRCLQSNIAVGVAPLRNLTGDDDQQRLTEAFTDDLVAELVQRGRGFSLRRLE